MLVKGTNLIGSKVITIQDGEEVDDVDDVIYDPQDNQVKALLVNPGGIFTSAKVIMLQDAKGIGKNAILIENEDSLKSSSDIKESLAGIATDGTHLTKLKVISENGNKLGTVNDIYFDTITGMVEEMEVSQGLEDIKSGKKRVRVADIITVGKDALIVKAYTEEKFARQKEEGGAIGMAKRRTKEAQQALPRIVNQARAKMQKLASQARKKAEELQKMPETRRAMRRAQGEMQQARTAVAHQISRAGGRMKSMGRGMSRTGSKHRKSSRSA